MNRLWIHRFARAARVGVIVLATLLIWSTAGAWGLGITAGFIVLAYLRDRRVQRHHRQVYLDYLEAGGETGGASTGEPLPDTCARCGDLVDLTSPESQGALLPNGREYCHACLLIAGGSLFAAWMRENPEPSALAHPGFWMTMRSLGNGVPALLLVWTLFFVMLTIWGVARRAKRARDKAIRKASKEPDDHVS